MHARVPGVRGGFIGVDVFFVISGYLITGLLSAEITRTGKVDLFGSMHGGSGVCCRQFLP